MRFSGRTRQQRIAPARGHSAGGRGHVRQHLAQHRRVRTRRDRASCARRSLAAETIFMALVICCVFFTERMRRRMSIKLGMRGYRLVVRHEAGLEFLDRRRSSWPFSASSSAFFSRISSKMVGMRVFDEAVQLLFELAALLHRQIVQEALRCRRR